MDVCEEMNKIKYIDMNRTEQWRSNSFNMQRYVRRPLSSAEDILMKSRPPLRPFTT